MSASPENPIPPIPEDAKPTGGDGAAVERRVQRVEALRAISALRGGRCTISLFTFDRVAIGPLLFAQLQFREDLKQALFRVLKETHKPGQGLDLVLYTRGGDVNTVWPIVSLLREFDENFEVLVPFRAHSAGTLLALGARRVHMGPLSELSPIDPTTANPFNPTDAAGNRLAISVEDVGAYMQFIRRELHVEELGDAKTKPADATAVAPFVEALTKSVHPLAIGNVQRVYRQIGQLADRLLGLHPDKVKKEGAKAIIKRLTSEFGSHNHKICRTEAREILGGDAVSFVPAALADAMDRLLVKYDDHFSLTKPFSLAAWIGDATAKEMRWVSGALESPERSYLFETKAVVRQSSELPKNVQVQLPPGQPVPFVPGLPRRFEVEVLSQRWMHNTAPLGVTV